MFRFFSKNKEPYKITFSPEFECDENIINILKACFYEIYNYELFLHRVDNVEFHVCDNIKFSGKVYNEELSFKNVKILISIVSFKNEKNITKVKNQIKEILTHEITHIKHKFFGIEFDRVNKYAKRKIGKNIRNLGLKSIDLKFQLDNLLYNCYMEGIAKYYEKEWKYTIDQLIKIYNYNYEQIIITRKIFLNHINEKINFNEIEKQNTFNLSYELGLLIVYTILLANEKMTQKDMFNLSFIKMYKLYEKSVGILNKKFNIDFKILFSYNSGNGIIDYSNFCGIIYDMKNR